MSKEKVEKPEEILDSDEIIEPEYIEVQKKRKLTEIKKRNLGLEKKQKNTRNLRLRKISRNILPLKMKKTMNNKIKT